MSNKKECLFTAIINLEPVESKSGKTVSAEDSGKSILRL